jgi:hypothetical protein
MSSSSSSQPSLEEEEENLYLSTLTPLERIAYDIAVEHLGSSFSLRKSVGFIKWKTSLVPPK